MNALSGFQKKQKAASFENQKLAAEKKKALLLQQQANALEKGVEKKSSLASAPLSAAPAPAPEVAGSSASAQGLPSHPKYGGANIRLHQDDSSFALTATRPLYRLVDIYLEAAANRTAHQVLLWPTAPKVLPLVHVLATMEHWGAGNKAGIRGLLYPAKDNTFHPLNHLALDLEDLGRHAQALYAIRTNSDKDPVLSRAVNTREVMPTINDLIPHFRRLKKEDAWPAYDDRLLEHTLKKVNRYSEKAALRANCAVLGHPKTAPDALFALGYQLDRAGLLDGLRALERLGRPDVCLINATRAFRATFPTLPSLIKRFFAAFLAAYPGDRPGLVFVTDDPVMGYRIRDIVDKECERAAKHNPSTVATQLIYEPIACQDAGELDQGIVREGTSEPEPPQPRKFRVEVKDADAGRLVKALYQIRQDLKLDEQSALPLTDAANFLHKIAALPTGIRDVEDWLDEVEADPGLRRKLAWSTARGALVEFVARGQAGALERKLESTITSADSLLQNYRDGTPIAYAMAEAAGAATGGGSRVVIVFTRPLLRMFAERFFKRQAFSNGKTFEDMTPHLHLIVTKQLSEHAKLNQATRYVFAGIDDEAIRVLMTENGIPKDSLLLLTQRTAIYTRRLLSPILENDEFRSFKARIEPIIQQLNARLSEHDVSLLRSDDFVLPSFDFSRSPHTRDEDPESWRIQLEGGQCLYRSAGTVAYTYDPVSDLTSRSGFVPKEVRSLEPGMQLFVMSESLHDQVEELLRCAGVPIEHDKPFEQTLRQYHQKIINSLNQHFPGKSLSAQVGTLKEQLSQEFPEIAKEFSNLRHWVNLGDALDTPFDELRPQAPRHFKVFLAFTSALGFSAVDAAYYWQAAIHPIRVHRRMDGRYVSDVYARILFDPESAMVHAKLSATAIASIFAEARQNIHSIVLVEPPVFKLGTL